MTKVKIGVFFAHKRKVVCSECSNDIPPGKLYFSILVDKFNFSQGERRGHLCKDCWDAINNKITDEYLKKKDNYGEYLKKRIVKNL